MLSYRNIQISMASPEICFLCKAMFYLPGLGGVLWFLFDEWEVHGILNDGSPFSLCTLTRSREFANLKSRAVWFGGVILTIMESWGWFQSETGRPRAQIKHWEASGTSQWCSPGLVLSQLSPSHPGHFYSPLWGSFPFLSRSKLLSWLLNFLALCLEMSILVPLCAITASWSEGPCFGVEIPISLMSFSILSRQQQCLDLRVLFFQT